MFSVAISGQHLGFNFISALSGTPLTGLSGLISGYKSIDGAAQAGISGFVTELAFGQYQANLFSPDVSGKIITFYFTGASGAVPVEKTVVTTLNVSGQIYPASGINAVVPSATLSGVTANSGLFVSVPISSISGVNVVASQASGTTFLASGSFLFGSGQFYLASGTDFLPSGSIFATTFASGVLAGSGQIFLASGTPLFYSGLYYVASGSVTASVSSGSLYLASGSIFKNTFASGVLGTSGGLPTAWGGSGAVTDGQNLDKTGYTLLSGQSYTASGINVTVPPATLSGVTPSFSPAVFSGIFSGNFVVVGSVLSGVFSGQQVTLTSGQSYTASGINATATVLSGQVYLNSGYVLSNSGQFYVASGSVAATANSGLFVSVPISSISGVNVVAAQGSGTTFLASGQAVYLYSGQSVNVYSGQLSGQPVTTGSGLFVSVPISSISGVNSVVPASTLSGVIANSGLFVSVPISSISGVNAGNVSVASGQVFLASGWPQQVLTYNFSGLPNNPVHTMVNALRKLIDRWDTTTNSGQLTVYLEDAASVAYMQPLTSQSGAAPVTALGDS
jgi:hypothetical protein